MSKKILVILSVSAAMMAGSAFAGEPGKGGSPALVNQAISWDEMQARCLHPEQFNVQKAPQNIVLQCGETSYDYVPASSGDVALPTVRTVSTTVMSDKFHVAAGARQLPGSASEGSCLRYKEVVRTLSVEHPLSCDEVLGMKGDVSDYCASTLDTAKGSNPKLVDVKDTGRVIDTCQGLTLVQHQPGTKGGDGKVGDGKGGDHDHDHDGKGDGSKGGKLEF